MSHTQQVDQIEQSEEFRNNLAFEVIEINLTTGETILVIQKGIIGPLADQLKDTRNRRKGASILRKMGYILSDCGDIQYGGDIGDTHLDPDKITNEPYKDTIDQIIDE